MNSINHEKQGIKPVRPVKPIEMQRWEGEGGNPPEKAADEKPTRKNFYEDPGPHIVNILRRLFKSWNRPVNRAQSPI